MRATDLTAATAAPAIDLVLGVGSAHGADQLGWLAIEHGRQLSWPTNLQWHACRLPSEIPNLLLNQRHVLILDAAITDAAHGHIASFTMADLPSLGLGYAVHGWGLVQSLQLAQALNMLPQHLEILTMNAGPEPALAFSPSQLQAYFAAVTARLNASFHTQL